MQQLDMLELMAPPPKRLVFEDITEEEQKRPWLPKASNLRLYVCGSEEAPRQGLKRRSSEAPQGS